MRMRVLWRALTTVALVGGTLVAAAAPAAAGNACGSTDPLVGAASGTVSTVDPTEWYRLTATTGVTVTMVATSGDPDLKVMDSGCGSVVCYPYISGTEACTLPAGTYQVGVLYYWGPGGVAGYSLSVAAVACSDGVDNDGDGKVDFPNDPGCKSGDDTSEGVACSVTSGQTVCAGISAGNEVLRQDLNLVTTQPGPTHHVVAKVDVYRFTLATGDTVSIPCVVLAADTTGSNACAAAGGTYVSTLRWLVDSTVTEASVVRDPNPFASVALCDGELVVTVDGIGITSARTVALCDGGLLSTNLGDSR